MARKLLIAVLILTLVIELGLAGGLFFAKDLISQQFGVAINADTDFLSYIIGWLCVFVSMIVALALWQLWQRDSHYAALCYIMGFFWIVIGIAVFIAFHKPDNLALDTAKGILIVAFTYWNEKGISQK